MFRGARVLALIVCELLVAARLPTVSYGTPAGSAPSVTPVTASVLVRPDEGATLSVDGVVLEIPAGAVTRAVTIKITRLPFAEPLGDSMSNVTSGGAAYRFEPHGMIFSRPVCITIPFQPRVGESESDLSNLSTYFFDEAAGRWERLQRQSINRSAAALTSVSWHFTDMVNATLTLPQGPPPVQFDMNSIKNLQAGNPGAGVPLPEGLQPGPFGSAGFSIALRLPPGRGSAAPALCLRYDSGLSNGWLGKGFDLEVPAITTDTRFGLPRYDGHDRYILNGEELVPWGTDGPAQRFRPRTEKNFQRIRWYRGGGKNYWEVTDKNGDVREYGREEAWVGPARSDRSRTFTWYLSRLRDTYGNTVDYTYSHDAANAHTYLSEIRYSGFEGTSFEPGQYRIRFSLEDREDRRIDCRGRFQSKLARRLSKVEVRFQEQSVRAYELAYIQNEFGQSLLSSFTEKNATGAAFYTYRFTYHALPERRDGQGMVVGYDAFGDAEQKWEAPLSPGFNGLHTSVNTSAGGSLYVGIEISLKFLWWKKVIASFGVRGGLDFFTGFTKEGFFDLNGDGLPDAVGMEGSSLVACLNNGHGFDVVPAFSLPGMAGRMDEESGSSRSVGLSAVFGPVSGGVTWQSSGSEAERSFADVNGDGFLDVVEKGSSRFLLNTGTALVSTPWQFGSPSEPGGSDHRSA